MNKILKKGSKEIKSFLSHAFFNNDSFKHYFEPIIENYIPEYSLLHTKAKVENIYLERPDVINLILKPQKNWKGFKAGQFIQLGFEINGIVYQRIFSISSDELLYRKEGIIRCSIQKQEKGKVTPYLFEHLAKHSFVQISEAMGNFIINNDLPSDVLFIAGGVGLTPILSILSSNTNSDSSFVLMYYASKERPHLFVDELLEIKKLNSNIEIHLLDSNDIGFFSENHLLNFCNDFQKRKIYLCGPQAMDKLAHEVLEKLNVEKSNIISESFTAQKFSTLDTISKDIEIQLSISNRKLHVRNDKTILELLENNNEQPKYGCRMGICNQCKCKKTEGLVYNIHTKSISDSGEEFIKICSTLPIGNIKLAL